MFAKEFTKIIRLSRSLGYVTKGALTQPFKDATMTDLIVPALIIERRERHYGYLMVIDTGVHNFLLVRLMNSNTVMESWHFKVTGSASDVELTKAIQEQIIDRIP